jgi:uncharacterized protein YwgA
VAKPVLETDDVIVLLLGAAAGDDRLEGRLDGITRLEKLVFLLEKEGGLDPWLRETAEFRSHNFGPFSAKVYSGVETLAAAGLLEESSDFAPTQEDTWESAEILGNDAAAPYSERRFRLTDRGRRYFESLVNELPNSVMRMIESIKERFAGLSLRQLVRYVYHNYEEYTDKSLIRKEVLGNDE